MGVLEQPQKDGYNLVELSWVDDSGTNYHRVTNWSDWVEDDLAIQYEPVPEMNLEIPPITFGFDERPLRFDLKLVEGGFVDLVSRAVPFNDDIRVTLREVRELEGDRKTNWLFVGRLLRTVRNHRGKLGVVHFECVNWKWGLNKIVAGLPTNPECENTFGFNGCSVDVQSRQEIGTITNIELGARIKVSGVSRAGLDVDFRYWRGGSVSYNGVTIYIRNGNQQNTFQLAREVPPEWEGVQAKFLPGCDRSLGMCRDVWDNEEDFAGRGRRIPAYNPLFENRTTET